jgi:class 3 adenylate cyclase/tetratricopeptide (TPR) repeat protein
MCGTAQLRRCPGCGGQTPPGAGYCSECGAALGRRSREHASSGQRDLPAGSGAEAHRQEAERRQLTVLFCDLVDSTALSARLDLEEYREIMTAYQTVTSAVVARFDGHVARYLGDGVMAYFGYPRAHEDDAQRAIRGGLGIIEAVRRLSARLRPEHDVSLEVRIGVHTGLVVTSEIGGSGGHERQVLGITPNLAHRLQEMASPNTLLMTDATARLVAGFFDTRNLGPRELRGIPEPVAIHQALHESTARSRLDVAGAAGLTPFTGRDAEMQHLIDRWEEAGSGRGQVAFVCGEPGIGKSRLVRVLEEHIAADPAAWLIICRGSPYYQNTAFYPIVDLIERVVLQLQPTETAEQKLRKLEGWLAQHGLQLDETVPLFGSLLSLQTEPFYPAPQLDPERQKLKIMEALLQILLERASIQPLLFVLEDLHWVDPSTLELLDRLLQRPRTGRIMVVVTYRPEFIPPWGQQPDVTFVTLNRLAREPSIEMIVWAAGGKALPPQVLEQVLARTDGVPLFLEELSKSVVESGMLQEVNGQYVASAQLPPMAIPSTLQDSLMARLDRLDTVRSVAQLGATLGREFSYELLQAVSSINEPFLRHALGQLVDAGLVYESGRPPDSRYQFKHALIQETAYESLLRGTRQQYHHRIAQALETTFGATADTQPELIAHHYTHAGMAESAIPYWQRAGQRALERAANLEAIAHFGRALELLGTLARTESLDRLELELRISLAPAYMAIKGWASNEVEETCRRAGDLAESLSDFQRQFGSLWGLWTNYFLRGKMRETLATGQEVLRLAQRADVPMLQVMARHAVGYSHFYRGEFEATREHAELGLGIFDEETERTIVRTFQFSSSAALRIMLGCSLWMLGHLERAPALVASGVDLTRQLSHHPSEAFALAASLLFHYYVRDVERAYAVSEELLQLAQQESFEIWTPFALMFHGWALVEKEERFDEGIAETRRGIAMWQATNSYLNQTITMAMLGDALWKAGQTDDALEVLGDELVAAHAREELHFAPELYRLQGAILAERAARHPLDDPESQEATRQAEAAFRRALELAVPQGARMLALRTAISLGRLLAGSGRADQAQLLLAEHAAGFPDNLESADLRAAQALADHLQQLQDRDTDRMGVAPSVREEG